MRRIRRVDGLGGDGSRDHLRAAVRLDSCTSLVVEMSPRATGSGCQAAFNCGFGVVGADTIDVADAVGLGLVNTVVAADRLLDEAMSLADRIAANGPLAVRVTKQLVRAASSLPEADVRAMQDELQPLVFGSDDAREGARAFTEKRDPVWTGH